MFPTLAAEFAHYYHIFTMHYISITLSAIILAVPSFYYLQQYLHSQSHTRALYQFSLSTARLQRFALKFLRGEKNLVLPKYNANEMKELKEISALLSSASDVSDPILACRSIEARSECELLLGEKELALEDSENAINMLKTHIINENNAVLNNATAAAHKKSKSSANNEFHTDMDLNVLLGGMYYHQGCIYELLKENEKSITAYENAHLADKTGEFIRNQIERAKFKDIITNFNKNKK